MKAITVIAALLGTAGVALAQGVTSAIAPSASAPAGCDASYSGEFEITVVKVNGGAKKRSEDLAIAKRGTCATDGTLVASLADGVLTDAKSRTGYIASNYQFQFDEPPQAGAIYTAGFSACSNGSLALGGSAVWYECDSGDFYNLYDRNWAAQCSPVEILIMSCGGTDSASETGDGQVVATSISTITIVSETSDGQPQVKTVTTGVPLCAVSQIGDGQVQVATTPCASITAVTTSATSTLAPVSQYSDGQIQVTPAASVPTVSSVIVTSTASGTPVSGASSLVLPSETLPVSSGASETGSSSTLATSAVSGSASSAAASGTSAPSQSGAGRVISMSSVGALMVSLAGAAILML